MFDTPYNTLIGWGPKSTTVSGLVWRLFWIWPAFQGLRLFAIACVSLAVGVAARCWNTEAYRGLAGFSPAALTSIALLIYFEIFSLNQSATFTVTSARALGVLPARSTRLRDAAWLADVVMAPLVLYGMSLLVIGLLPLAFVYKTWFAVALLYAALVILGLRASTVLQMLKRDRLGVQTNMELLYRRIDGVMHVTTNIFFIGLFLGADRAWITPAAAGAGALIFIWAYLRLILRTRGTVGDAIAPLTGTQRFSSAGQEWLRMFWPALTLPIMFIVMMRAMTWYLGVNSNGQWPMMMAILSGGMSTHLTMRLRAFRLLPLSTLHLTLGVILYGAVAAVPMLFIVAYLAHDVVQGGWLLLLAASVGLTIIGTTAGGLWMLSYRLPYFAAMMVFMMIVMVPAMEVGVISHKETGDLGTLPELLISFAFILAVIFTAGMIALAHFRFFWNSKTYRPSYQTQEQMNVNIMGDRGEIWLLGLYALTSAAALLFTAITLASAK